MAIVTGLTKRLEIPHEKGEWIIIRQLSWRQKERATDQRTNSVLERVRNMGPALMQQLQGVTARPDVQAAMADPVANFDRGLILEFGIVDWSYKTPVSTEAVGELDEETAAWAMREIVAFSTPPSEDEQKNASSPST